MGLEDWAIDDLTGSWRADKFSLPWEEGDSRAGSNLRLGQSLPCVGSGSTYQRDGAHFRICTAAYLSLVAPAHGDCLGDEADVLVLLSFQWFKV